MSRRRTPPLPAFVRPPRARSENMRAILSARNRTTERRLRALLTQAGVSGWRVRPANVAGAPDFAFLADHVLIFVDGCFWHGCPRCGREPKTNSRYWTAKIVRNRSRDRRVRRFLRSRGYTVLRIWECDLRGQPAKCVARIQKALTPRL